MGSPLLAACGWRCPPGAREVLSQHLAATDLQTLLLSVVRDRAASVTPAEVLRRWQSDRFVRPAQGDPRLLSQVEARVWSLDPSNFEGVELSPVAPLGTCSALVDVSQDRVLATVRRSEVISDSTNALAVEAAARRKSGAHEGGVHLAACHRQLRAQDFGEGRSAHFRLFTLVSSAPNQGSGRQESNLLSQHLRCWTDVVREVLPETLIRIELTAWDRGLRERIHEAVLPEFEGDPLVTVVETALASGGRATTPSGRCGLSPRLPRVIWSSGTADSRTGPPSRCRTRRNCASPPAWQRNGRQPWPGPAGNCLSSRNRARLRSDRENAPLGGGRLRCRYGSPVHGSEAPAGLGHGGWGLRQPGTRRPLPSPAQ